MLLNDVHRVSVMQAQCSQLRKDLLPRIVPVGNYQLVISVIRAVGVEAYEHAGVFRRHDVHICKHRPVAAVVIERFIGYPTGNSSESTEILSVKLLYLPPQPVEV